MMRYHAIERTSPKGPGSPFIGTCRLCGTNFEALVAALGGRIVIEWGDAP